MSADVSARVPAAESLGQESPRIIEPNATTIAEIEQAISESGGAIPFSQYMDIALYGADGYYSKGKADIRGGKGDFSTWPVDSTDFCEAIGVAVSKIWVAMGEPRFNLIESGAGTGVMMKDILVWMREERPGMYRNTNAHIVERGDMALQQRLTVGGRADTRRRSSRAEVSTPDEHKQDLEKVRWHHGSAIEATISQEGPTVFISNELPDAFPVEVVRRQNGLLEQKYVAMENGELVAQWRPLQPDVQGYMQEFSVDVSEGAEMAINLNAIKWQRHLGRVLQCGGIITVDYGLHGPREYRPGDSDNPKPQDNLGRMISVTGGHTLPKTAVRTYPKGFDPLDYPGEIDLTSDVDFKALTQVATQSGLEVAFSGPQIDLLVACGFPTIGELNAIEPHSRAEFIRLAVAKLLHGASTFRALVLTRGVTVDFTTR